MSSKLILTLFFTLIIFTSSNFSFTTIYDKIKAMSKKKIAVAAAEGIEVLRAVRAAKDRGVAEPVLIGNKKEIEELSTKHNLDIHDFQIIDEPDQVKAARKAVKMVHDHEADMLMKGVVDTKDYLKAILDKEIGLRTGRPLTSNMVVEVPEKNKVFICTDGGIIMYPTLEDKVHMINGAVELAKAMGIETPKVAGLAAVEVINPKMPATVDAGKLSEMQDKGEIKDCIVEGPLSLDLAIDPQACVHKKATHRKVVGDADILLFPDIHSCNLSVKILQRVSKHNSGGIISGPSAPCIITSRADDFETRLNSIILATVYADYLQKHPSK